MLQIHRKDKEPMWGVGTEHHTKPDKDADAGVHETEV